MQLKALILGGGSTEGKKAKNSRLLSLDSNNVFEDTFRQVSLSQSLANLQAGVS
jgi:hypothetical protein